MNSEQAVALHYTRGAIGQAVLDALVASGKDPNRLTIDDLAAVDEFHLGGRQATMDFADEIGFAPGARLLDIGCGIGGPARYFAQARGCAVAGVDLTDEFVRVAEDLTRRVGLSDRISLQQGSALALPFADASFDGAYMIHVGMNIADKATLFAQVRRVLRPRGLFCIYDIMRERDGDLPFPLPWASAPATSFVEPATAYRRLLEAAGFEIVKQRSRRDFAIAFLRELRERAAQSGGPPALGLQLVMGPAAPAMIANITAALDQGLIAPTELIARAI